MQANPALAVAVAEAEAAERGRAGGRRSARARGRVRGARPSGGEGRAPPRFRLNATAMRGKIGSRRCPDGLKEGSRSDLVISPALPPQCRRRAAIQLCHRLLLRKADPATTREPGDRRRCTCLRPGGCPGRCGRRRLASRRPIPVVTPATARCGLPPPPRQRCCQLARRTRSSRPGLSTTHPVSTATGTTAAGSRRVARGRPAAAAGDPARAPDRRGVRLLASRHRSQRVP
jgi:hypothetical protein